MTDDTTTATDTTDAAVNKTFTQEEVNSIVKERLAQQRKNEFGDYADLKAKAEGAKTLEDRVASLEGELTTTRAESARNSIAAKYGISTERPSKDEPSDAELLLTGSDAAVMEKVAQRFVANAEAQKTKGNVARKEGQTTTTGNDQDATLREFATRLFASAQND